MPLTYGDPRDYRGNGKFYRPIMKGDPEWECWAEWWDKYHAQAAYRREYIAWHDCKELTEDRQRAFAEWMEGAG